MFFFQPKSRKTDIAQALEFLNRILTRRAIVFVISDFFDGDFSRPLTVSAKRHDVIALPIVDPVEENFPNVGVITLQDPETGEQVEVNTGAGAFREAYQEESERQKKKLIHLFGSHHVDTVPLRTDEDYLPILRSFFAHRERRR